MNTILITGGAGYIGSHACVEFLQAGYNIVVLDNLCNSSAEALQRVRELTGQINVQKQSYSEILRKAEYNEGFFKSIPAMAVVILVFENPRIRRKMRATVFTSLSIKV